MWTYQFMILTFIFPTLMCVPSGTTQTVTELLFERIIAYVTYHTHIVISDTFVGYFSMLKQWTRMSKYIVIDV